MLMTIHGRDPKAKRGGQKKLRGGVGWGVKFSENLRGGVGWGVRIKRGGRGGSKFSKK